LWRSPRTKTHIFNPFRMPKVLHFRYLVLCFFALVSSAPSAFAQPDVAARADSTIRAYIESHKDFAIAEMRRTGIPASVTLGQAICESRYGTSKVAMQAHNHFGIKCYDTWQGKRYFHKDDERKNGVLVPSCFRYYTSDSASYADHSEFLMTRPWYDFLFKYASDDYMSWIKGLNKAGYANAKDYDERILKHIKNYELYKLDEKGFPLQPRKTDKIVANTPKKGGKTPVKPEKDLKIANDAIFIPKDTSRQVATTVKKVAVQPSLPPTKKDPKAAIFIPKDTTRNATKTVAMNVMPPSIPDKIPTKKPATAPPTTVPSTTTRLAAFGNAAPKTSTNTGTNSTANQPEKINTKTDTIVKKTVIIAPVKTLLKDTTQAKTPTVFENKTLKTTTIIQDSLTALQSAPDKIVHDTEEISSPTDTLKRKETEEAAALKNKLQRFKTTRTVQPAADSTLKTPIVSPTDTIKRVSRINPTEPEASRALTIDDVKPVPTDTKPSDIKPSDTKPVTQNKKTHTVIAGDSLYGIAKKYAISLEKLRTLNNLGDKSPKIGDVLVLE
jgi:Mannosyl-glycoprotein endo-beta-N-acetylglucosaminidase/LysM domain